MKIKTSLMLLVLVVLGGFVTMFIVGSTEGRSETKSGVTQSEFFELLDDTNPGGIIPNDDTDPGGILPNGPVIGNGGP